MNKELQLQERTMHVISGVNGSGKTRLLERIFREEGEKGGRAIVYLKAPTRSGSSGPVFLSGSDEEPDPKVKEILYRMLSSKLGPHVSSEEIPLLLLSAYEKGALRKGSLLLIDEVDAGVHPSSEIALLVSLGYLLEILSLTVVITTESLVVVRGTEELFPSSRFYQTMFGSFREVTGATELLYRELTEGASIL